ncbi:F-box family protein [Rhynchospora pubera]|uniref:F-box family protein n=1 Tax=Rhynchospora pubera TaxID=906938 RepID=A0AAV8DZ48_9POAL|nr:F-box family protein [Rhynchospora pubera]
MDSPSEFRDWANLPPQIIDLISEKVKYIVDYVRLRAICSTWRSASRPRPRHLPPQLPWLMLPYDGHSWTTKEDTTHFFYDVWESKMREIHLLETETLTCCASYLGWLLLVSYKGRYVSLLNPLTRSQIKLPRFMAWFDPYMISFGMSKMTFSADLTDPNCLITVFLEDNSVISCQVGDRFWKRYYYPSKDLADVTCYNGRLYFLDEGEMVIIEYNKPEDEGFLEPGLTGHIVVLADFVLLDNDEEPEYIAAVELTVLLEPELAAAEKYFVEGKSGVCVVAVHLEGKFMLYQFQEQQMKLEKITTDSCDSTAIFFGDNNTCLALSSDDWDSLDGGSLYMEDRCVPDGLKLAAVKSGYHAKFAEMVDGNVMYWYEKNQKSPYQYHQAAPAVWFQPSFF